ncbi:hypothetical protein QYF36_019148 [Acer negundo]|nr:hypothetical protein QYF36_019148 [Acer negundo]
MARRGRFINKQDEHEDRDLEVADLRRTTEELQQRLQQIEERQSPRRRDHDHDFNREDENPFHDAGVILWYCPMLLLLLLFLNGGFRLHYCCAGDYSIFSSGLQRFCWRI